jgi:hypothetical protein
LGEILGEHVEVADGVLGADVESHSGLVRAGEGELELGEQAPPAGNCQRHAAKFAEELVPCFEGDSGAACDFCEDCVKSEAAMWW